MNWYVLYTKPRHEKTVAEKLSASGIEVYCPLLRQRKLWSDRWKWVEEPLFRSYCFVHLPEDERERVFGIPGIIRYIFHCGKPAIIRSAEMELLKTWLIQYEHLAIESININPKDRIKIRSGALAEKEAEVVESKGHYALLNLESLGLQVRVDLRKNILEKITTYNF